MLGLFKRSPKVDISEDDYDRYKEYARRANLSVEDWVRNTLDRAAPRVSSGADAAFEYLDKDHLSMSHRVLPVKQEGHPCKWLSKSVPAGWDRSTCSGSCAHPRPRRPVCTWQAKHAHMCPIFKPKY